MEVFCRSVLQCVLIPQICTNFSIQFFDLSYSKSVDLQQVISNSSIAKKEEAKDECMSCYGAESRASQCCNTCDEVKTAYRRKGWALDNMEQVEQCKGEAEKESMSQEEGCQVGLLVLASLMYHR